MSSSYFDVAVTILFVSLIIGGALSGNDIFYLATIELVAVLFMVAYLKPHYSIFTEASHSFVEVAFFPKTKHWLLVLFVLLNGLIVFEVASAAIQHNH